MSNLNGEEGSSKTKELIVTSLESKEKLCFVDGSLPSPSQSDAVAYRRWKNADSMVKAWIINSISKDLANHFIYFPSALSLWKELETRYGLSCGPQIYQIQRLINTFQQGNDPVSTYYGRLYKCWDELHRLMPRTICTYAANKTNEEIDCSLKLNQFLMGLNDTYDALRSQILAMKPKPSVSEAFSMVAQMETEKEVKLSHSGGSVITDASALLANSVKNGREHKGGKKKENKKDLHCDHCGYFGHTKETCFKLNGYPDWWKEKKASGTGAVKKQQANLAVNDEADNPLEMKDSTDFSTMISQLVRQEIAKLSKGKTGDEVVSFAHTDFAGNASNLQTLKVFGTWIVDTGASSHMSHDKNMLSEIKVLESPITVHLPYGKTIIVKEVGRAIINDDLTLENVLLIPSFKYNLLSDNKTKRVLAVGNTIGSLYYLKQKVLKMHENCNNALSSTNSSNAVMDATVFWHHRLGHAPLFVLNKAKIGVASSLPVCDICYKAKQQRMVFPVSSSRASDLFSLIHVDVWGRIEGLV
ncbi:uncharacterized protein G2W53_037140 [Senna tora]|uniref:Retrovirus-related Pol polyprotein from transposon TNT 1-94-like beta-barrel domain-containing protein n=1 Tax=Senna tora TaxID=362788 RepID=A0A834W5T5_9FABA|nr:uncharacterized protein G2W53_037140 [Senna tora]